VSNEQLYAEYRAARQRAFRLLQEIRERTDAWLTAHEHAEPDWTAIAHFEGLGLERQRAVDELQASERRLIDALVAGISSQRPAPEKTS
jgi:hypothetical protein